MRRITTGTMPTSEGIRLDLAAEVLSRFGQVRFIAHGSSMIPTIYPGDLVTVGSAALVNIRSGDVVLCLREGRFWLHRLTRKCQEGNRVAFVTQGDALSHEDPPADKTQLLGRVTSIVRYGKSQNLGHAHAFHSMLLPWSVRNFAFLATSLLRLHSLRARILRTSQGTLVSVPCRSPESIR